MTFVSEKIPEEVKDKFTFDVRMSNSGKKLTLSRWVIDRDRDAFLVHTHSWGGGFEGTQQTEYCILCWKGNEIKLSVEMTAKGNRDVGRHLSWRIFDVRIPASLKTERDEVLGLIKEAIKAKDWPINTEGFDSININLEDSIAVIRGE
jgi:hypothetical protein